MESRIKPRGVGLVEASKRAIDDIHKRFGADVLQTTTRMSRLGSAPPIHYIDGMFDTDQHIRDAIVYGVGAKLQHVPPTVQVKHLSDYTDAEMVMDMLRRGFAVMRLPEDGGPPEALR